MGFNYLKDQSWAEVTRDERFFCAHLYHLVTKNDIDDRKEGTKDFVRFLKDKLNLNLNPDANWELGYEVCFYRDYWHLMEKKVVLYSPKRTFDLCLFSDDTIVIIEAKAQQDFDDDQSKEFIEDITKIKELKLAGIENVYLCGLKSSKYLFEDKNNIFKNGIIDWIDFFNHYNEDSILQRADEVWEPKTRGKNNTGGYMTGDMLEKAYNQGQGKYFFVGRDGGLDGEKLSSDIRSGNWMSHNYETNREAKEPPNEKNWFLLSDFMKKIGG